MSKAILLNSAFILLLAISCKDQEEIYPAETRIEFIGAEFDEGRPFELPPSLFITFSITDGDMNVGLDMTETNFPYQFAYYYLKEDGLRIPSDKLERGEIGYADLIQIEDRLSPPFDTLPDPAIFCKYLYYTISELPNYQTVQLYADRNENFSNLRVKILLKEQDGSFVEEDLSGACFFDRNNRLPRLDDLSIGKEYLTGPLKITMHSRQKGQITYQISSNSFMALKSQTLKVKLFVKDRALNNSNVVETHEFRPEDL